MQIAALLGITNPQAEVPNAGTTAGFEMLIAQLLAAEGGPEPPGAPPGDPAPCGEKLTTPEPNAPSIQPDSAADAQNANLAFAMALVQTDLLGSPVPTSSQVPAEVRTKPVIAEPLIEIAPEVLLSKSPATLDERAALRTLINNPELGMTRITVDRAPEKVPDVIVPSGTSGAIDNNSDAVVPRTPVEEITKHTGVAVPRPSETRSLEALVPRNEPVEAAKTPDAIASRNAQVEPAMSPNAEMPGNPDESTSSGAGAVLPRHAETQSSGAVAPRTELSETTDSIDAALPSNPDTTEQSFGEPAQDRSDQQSPQPPKPAMIEAAAPTVKPAASPKIEAVDRPAPNHELIRTLADRIETALATRPQERITIEFRPLDLGDIKVVLTQQNDQVEAQIISDNERVRQAVHAVQPELRQSLEQRGVQLGSFSVSDFGTHQESGRHGAPHHQPTTPHPFREFVPTPVQARPIYAAHRAQGVDLSI